MNELNPFRCKTIQVGNRWTWILDRTQGDWQDDDATNVEDDGTSLPNYDDAKDVEVEELPLPVNDDDAYYIEVFPSADHDDDAINDDALA